MKVKTDHYLKKALNLVLLFVAISPGEKLFGKKKSRVKRKGSFTKFSLPLKLSVNVPKVLFILTKDILRLVAMVTSLLLGELQPLVEEVEPRPCVDACALLLHSITTKSLQCL